MFIARQPIFNKIMKIYGYELLFRSDSTAQTFGDASSMSATATVMGGLFEQGIDKVVGTAKAFVNFDYDFIMSDNIELINPKTLIIEVLETIKVEEQLVERLKYLSRKGYRIALDDFEDKFDTYPIMPIADIIKYDIIATPLDTIEQDVKQALLMNKILLAEKIETEEEFEKAVEMGFHLFQGYFFSKPKIVSESNTKRTSKIHYARIIKELKEEEPSYNSLTKIIESDVNLAYRVMRVISHRKGSGSFNSIKNALIRMGLIELERWISILMLQEISSEQPVELMKLSLVRSRFGELIASNSILKNRKDEVSMMCLFSMLDAILNQPIKEALEDLSISEDVFYALVYHEGALRPVLKLILAYERGDWAQVQIFAKVIKIDTKLIYEGYLEAIEWASELLAAFE